MNMKKFFRTYFPFASNQIKACMAYKGSVYLFILCGLFGSLINYYLWKAVYGSAGGGVIGGLTVSEMVIYVFMTYVTRMVANVSINEEVSFDVVKGTVANNLIKPIDYRMSIIFKGFGYSMYNFVMPAVFVWIGVEIYRAKVLCLPFTGWVNLLLYVLSMMLSLLIYLLFDFCFGLIAFFTTYIFGLQMIESAVLSFLTGQLIPLTFFPDTVQKVFNFLPFSSMTYAPVMIYLGKFQGSELAFVLLRQVIWVVLLYVIGSLIWKRVTKRLIVLGG